MPGKSETLSVWFQDRKVGTIQRSGSHDMTFAYERQWLHSGDSFAVSQSLLHDAETHAQGSGNFFANLLPEGGSRRRLRIRLGMASDSDFELLERIVGDCAGALRILPEDSAPLSQGREYRLIPADRLHEHIAA